MNVHIKNEMLKKFIEKFSETGIENTSIRDLCKHAGVNSKDVYQLFENKENIVIQAGLYVNNIIETELRKHIEEYANNNVLMGEYFFDTFKKYVKEIRFCIQLMSSPNPAYQQLSSGCANIRAWSDEVAGILGIDKDKFEALFLLFMSMMYYYCMTGDERAAKIQRYYLYETIHNETTESKK